MNADFKQEARATESMVENISESKLQAHVDAGLSQEQLEELAVRLADKRRELTERIVKQEQQIVVKDDCSLLDAVDAASQQENRLRALSMLEQYRQVIKEIDAALHRLGNGLYGVDETTGEPIGYARLELVPWARNNTGGNNDE